VNLVVDRRLPIESCLQWQGMALRGLPKRGLFVGPSREVI